MLLLTIALAGRRLPGDPPDEEDRPRLALFDPTEAPAPETVRDRWGLIEAVGVHARWWDPYNQNPLKGDRPIAGQWFFSASAVGVAEYHQSVEATAAAGASLSYGGATVFRPPRALVRGMVGTDGKTAEPLQAYAQLRVLTLKPTLDSWNVRVGLQPVSSDSRGLLYRGSMESARVYGTLAGNRVQTSVLMTREGLVGGSTYVRCGPLDLSVQAAANDSTRWLGAGADGHLGRLNLSVVGWWDGEAALAATELSVDRDWLRLRLSGFHQPEAFVSLAPDPWLVVSSSWHQSGAGAATLLGPGVQAQLLPTLDANADALWTTEGVDLSAGLGFRPLFNQVLVLRADTALLFGDELTPSVRVRGVFSW